jgi:hypothetical protein
MDQIWLDILPKRPVEPARLAAAWAVLRSYGATPLEGERGFRVSLSDGTSFELALPSLLEDQVAFHGTLFPYGKVGREFSNFVYDFASAIGCVIRLDRRPPVTLAPHPALVAEVSPELTGTVVRVSSGTAVFNQLCLHYGMS